MQRIAAAHPWGTQVLEGSLPFGSRQRKRRMNKDQAQGIGKDAAGKVQEAVGEITGDKTQEAKGLLKQAEGKAQEKLGDAKEKLGDAKEALKDASK